LEGGMAKKSLSEAAAAAAYGSINIEEEKI